EARLATLEGQLGEQATTRARIEALRRDIKAIDDETPALHMAEEQIAELNTTLELNDYAHDERVALARLDAEIAASGYTPEQHRDARAQARALARWADEEQRLRRAEERRERDGRALARAEELLQRRAAEGESAEAQLASLEEELRALGPAIRERDAIAAACQIRRRELSVAERDLGEKRALLQRAEDAAVELIECEARRMALTERKGLFDEL